jgi:alcohol dehydrogenase class IV
METRGPELRKFLAPEVVFGVGSLHLAGQYGRNLGGSKALVVSDPGVAAAGCAHQVLASVGGADLAPTLYTQVAAEIARLEEAAGLGGALSRCGIHRTEVHELAGIAIHVSCVVTNPRRPGQRDIEVIYEESL